MNLLNEQVTHKSFGMGSVVGHNNSCVEVCFRLGNKKFVFPDAFGTHLVLVDPKIAKLVDDMKRVVQKKQREKELELERVREIEEAKQQRLREREQLIRNYKLSPASQAVFWCEEQELEMVFSEWRVFTGLTKSGPNKGKPNRLARVHPNSCCLITTRELDEPEKDRRISGVYMVDERFVGKLCETGYIPAHSEYRLRLSDEESRKLLFWNYYINERYPGSMTWNSGRHRYFDNVWMAQILQDILAFKKDSDEKEFVQSFLEYFCQTNHLVKTHLPKPNGALLRIESSSA